MMGFGGGIVMWLLVLVVVIAVVSSIWRPRSSDRDDDRDVPRHQDALTILETRYAKGEIDREEFERKKRDLMGS